MLNIQLPISANSLNILTSINIYFVNDVILSNCHFLEHPRNRTELYKIWI